MGQSHGGRRFGIGRKKESSTIAATSAQPLSDDFPTAFSYNSLVQATNNFSSERLIGRGGFGQVYKGNLDRAGTPIVAIKQLMNQSQQGNREFIVEVLMLSLLRHPNIVNLVGYCDQSENRLIVYKYMPLGSLHTHLHERTPGMKALDWKTRMKIATGVARGLNYLHNEFNPPVIYKDLKSHNVLLDEGFHPILSDFGIAKFVLQGDGAYDISRMVGTHAYVTPEYAATGKFSFKSDVYSYGVVLLQIVTGRLALDKHRERGKELLVNWLRKKLTYQEAVDQADPFLEGQFPQHIFGGVLKLALKCTQDNPESRPSMTEVLYAMEYFSGNPPYDPNMAQRRREFLFEVDEGVGSHAEASRDVLERSQSLPANQRFQS